jgi:DNA-binding PadR family transcriptional regulator
VDSPYAERQEAKILTREDVREILPVYTLLCAKVNGGKIHGYGVVKNLEEDFNMRFSASEVYPTCWDLEKNGFLTSEILKGERGKPRREYHVIEPKTSRYIDRFFKIRSVVMSRLETMRRDAERNDSGIEISIALPDAMAATRLGKWSVRAGFN